MDGGLVHVDQGVDHRDVEERTLTGSLPPVERQADGSEGVHPGVRVGDGRPDQQRRSVGEPGHVGDAAVALGDEVERRSTGERDPPVRTPRCSP